MRSLPYDLKFVITLVTLFVLYPVGLILMYVWMNWPKWLKVIITLPAVYAVIVGFILAIDFSRSVSQENKSISPESRQDAERILNCARQCAEDGSIEYDYCVDECTD